MGGLVNSRGQELNTLTTTFPINNGLYMWVDPDIIPLLESGVQKYTYDTKTMTYTLL